MHREKAQKLDSTLWRANRPGNCYLVAAAPLPENIFCLTDTVIASDQWGFPSQQELPPQDELLLSILQEIISYRLRYNVCWFAFQAVITPILDMTDGKIREDVYFRCNIAADRKALYNPERSLSFYIHSERELIKLLHSDMKLTRYTSGAAKRSVYFDTDPEEPLWDCLKPLPLDFSQVRRVYSEVKRTTRSKRTDVLWIRIALACQEMERQAAGQEKYSALELDLMDLLRSVSKKNLQHDPRFRQCLVCVEGFPSVSYELHIAWDPERRSQSPRYRPKIGKEKAA